MQNYRKRDSKKERVYHQTDRKTRKTEIDKLTSEMIKITIKQERHMKTG